MREREGVTRRTVCFSVSSSADFRYMNCLKMIFSNNARSTAIHSYVQPVGPEKDQVNYVMSIFSFSSSRMNGHSGQNSAAVLPSTGRALLPLPLPLFLIGSPSRGPFEQEEQKRDPSIRSKAKGLQSLNKYSIYLP